MKRQVPSQPWNHHQLLLGGPGMSPSSQRWQAQGHVVDKTPASASRLMATAPGSFFLFDFHFIITFIARSV